MHKLPLILLLVINLSPPHAINRKNPYTPFYKASYGLETMFYKCVATVGALYFHHNTFLVIGPYSFHYL